jgi:chromosomal replication initiation ATPase DnaA
MNPLIITQEVAQKYNLLPQDILSKRRLSEYVVARKEVAQILFNGGMSKSAIGRFLNHKDHTTIAKWIKK